MSKLPHWIDVAPDCNPFLRELFERAFGTISYACSQCGITVVESPGGVCDACQRPDVA